MKLGCSQVCRCIRSANKVRSGDSVTQQLGIHAQVSYHCHSVANHTTECSMTRCRDHIDGTASAKRCIAGTCEPTADLNQPLVDWC